MKSIIKKINSAIEYAKTLRYSKGVRFDGVIDSNNQAHSNIPPEKVVFFSDGENEFIAYRDFYGKYKAFLLVEAATLPVVKE